MEQAGELIAVLDTDKGTIRLKLYGEKTPLTVSSFVNLAQKGFYDGLTFHRVIDNFMIQGGCPSGDGRGGPGFSFEDEFLDELRHDKPGILSMANSGPATNGSQFFITHVPTPWLDDNHTVFGEVLENEDLKVVNSIEQGDKILNVVIKGETTELMKKNAARISEWNKSME